MAICGCSMTYITPPTFAINQYLSAYKIRTLKSNREHFNGLADALEMVQSSCHRGFTGYGNIGDSATVYDGYIYLTQNHLHFICELDANASGGDISTTLTLYDTAGTSWIMYHTHTAGTSAIQTYDATDRTKNAIYRVLMIVTRESAGEDMPKGSLHFLYEDYQPATLSYTVPTTLTDGVTSAVTDFTYLTTNDAYFHAIESQNQGFTGITKTNGNNNGTHTIWEGWVRHRHNNGSNHGRVYYKCTNTPAVEGTTTLQILYDATDVSGYGAETVLSDATAGIKEGSFNLIQTFIVGIWYLVRVQLVVADCGGNSAAATVHYLYTGPNGKHTGFVPMGEISAGQFGWGTTTNQRSRLDLLRANDVNLNSRLVGTNWSMHNAAVHKGYFTNYSTIAPYGSVTIVHRKSILYYRGKGTVTMSWGTSNAQGLTDYDASHPYQTLDLNSVQNLAMGQIYTISASNDAAANIVEWAEERDN